MANFSYSWTYPSGQSPTNPYASGAYSQWLGSAEAVTDVLNMMTFGGSIGVATTMYCASHFSVASTFPSLLSDQLVAQVNEVPLQILQNWMAKGPAATDLLPVLFSAPPLKWEQPSERALLAEEWRYFDNVDQANYNCTFYILDSMQALIIGAWFDGFLVLNKWQETLLSAIRPNGSTRSSAVPSTFNP